MNSPGLMASPFARVRGIFYGWKLVGIALLVTALAGGTVWSGVGVWVKALELQFGWSRTQLTGAFSLAQLEGSVVGPIMGYLVDRLGPKRMVLMGLAIIGLGFIVFSRTEDLVIFYVAYALITLGTAAGVWLPMMSVINSWFNRKRSRAMAVAGEGFALGGLLIVPTLAWAVDPSHIGWSRTALVIGAIFLVVAWPISRSIRVRPEDYGEVVDGDPIQDPTAGLTTAQGSPRDIVTAEYTPDFTARQAIRTRAFWFITFGHALSAMLIGTLTVHMVPMLTDQGLSLQSAAFIWSVLMGVSAVFELVGGYLGDRMSSNKAIFGFAAVQTVGFLIAAFVDSVAMAVLFAVVYGIGFGGRAPLTTAIRGEYFGKRAFATITGISMAPLYALLLAAPLFAATLFDATDSYRLAFLILGGLGALSGPLFLFAKKPEPIFERTDASSLPS